MGKTTSLQKRARERVSGESAGAAVSAAVANAAYQTTAVRARDLPVTLDQIHLQRPAWGA